MNLRLRWIEAEWWHRVVVSSLLSWRRSGPVQAVPGLNVGRDYRCRDWDFTWVSSVHPEKWRCGTSFSVRPLPSQSLPLHHCYQQPCLLSCWQCSAAKHMKDTAHCWHFEGHTCLLFAWSKFDGEGSGSMLFRICQTVWCHTQKDSNLE